jgi:hypothetical protein
MATPSLQAQLLRRVETFRANFPSISKADIARHCGIDEANFSAALNGRRGLGADAVLRLHRLMNLSKREVFAKFSTPARSSKILCLQENGSAKMSLDNIGGDGWLPREGTSGDPNGTDDITSIVGAASENGYDQATVDVLRQCRALHRKAIRSINSILQKASPNPERTTVPTSQRFSR